MHDKVGIVLWKILMKQESFKDILLYLSMQYFSSAVNNLLLNKLKAASIGKLSRLVQTLYQ